MTIQVFGSESTVSSLNRAFTDSSPSNTIFNEQLASAKRMGDSAFASAFATGFSYLSDAELSKKVLTNMGILPTTDSSVAGLEQALADYFQTFAIKTTNENGAVTSDTRGLIVLQLATVLANAEVSTGNLAVYNAAAVAWNSEVSACYTYSSNNANISPSSSSSTGLLIKGTNGGGNFLFGTSGSDTIEGGSGGGTDEVTGSGGADKIILNGNAQSTTIYMVAGDDTGTNNAKIGQTMLLTSNFDIITGAVSGTKFSLGMSSLDGKAGDPFAKNPPSLVTELSGTDNGIVFVRGAYDALNGVFNLDKKGVDTAMIYDWDAASGTSNFHTVILVGYIPSSVESGTTKLIGNNIVLTLA